MAIKDVSTKIKELLSVMDKKLDGITERLDDPDTGLDRLNNKMDVLWDQTEKLTLEATETQDILSNHTKALKQIINNTQYNNENTKKLEKRLKHLENVSGIVAPPELQLA